MPQFVSSTTTANSSATTNLVINVPASTQAGDLLIVHALVHNSTTQITPPTGWTVLVGSVIYLDSTSYLFYKTHSGSEPASYTFTLSASYTNTGAMLAFRDAMVQTTTSQVNAASTSLIAPNATVYNPSILLNLYGQHTSSVPTFTDSSGTLTKLYGFGNGSGYCSQTAFYQTMTTSGSATSKTITSSISGDNIGYSLVLVANNQPPNAPTMISPTGSLQAPTLMNTLTPVFSWTFSDPDAGQSQSAFQYLIYDSSNTVIYDSGQNNGTYTSCQLPTGVIQPNTLYAVIVRTWDNAVPPMAGYWATKYFKTTQAPTITNLRPGSANSATPDYCTVTPQLSWFYSDPDVDVQNSFQITISDSVLASVVYTSPRMYSTNTSFTVPTGALNPNKKYSWSLKVWDSTQMSTTASGGTFFTNALPAPINNLSPSDNCRVPVRPVLMGVIGDDADNNAQHVKLQVADDSSFSLNLQEFTTTNSVVGWEVYNGTAWVAFPSGGADPTYEGKQVRYTFQTDLTYGKTYYWRIAPIDSGSSIVGQWSSTNRMRIGDTLQFQLKHPITTSLQPRKIVIAGKAQLPTDGAVPASLKVEVCNNGLDSTPTWEDATATYTTSQYYAFTNTVKTAASWAVDCRITVLANSSTGTIEFDGIGFSFQ